MSRQDKATTDRNARTLRELVKQPDNKSCADCRKNDARWASWNLGVFLCIRCSGIHRSMGTHISRVKSIDLDIWTPDQMESVQKWGNRRANLYWEKHLKAGHVPPEHKIESFIRSKYESRRWAMDGPPPSDPSVLENAQSSKAPQPPPIHTASKPTSTSSAPAPAPAAAPKTHPLLSRTIAAKPTPTAAPVVDLIGGDDAEPTSAPPASTSPSVNGTNGTTAAASAPAPTSSSIFDLDFKAPSTSTAQKPQSNKSDIMSLFSATSPAATQQNSFFSPPNPPQAQSPYASWGGGATSTSTAMQSPTQAPIVGWGGMPADTVGWGAPQSAQNGKAPATTAGAGFGGWNASPQQTVPANNTWNAGADPWASAGSPQAKKQDTDPFANIWK